MATPLGRGLADARPAPPRRRPGSRRAGPLHSARVRLVAAVSLLLLLSAAVSLVAIRQVLIIRLDARVDSALAQETAEFQRLAQAGRDPATGLAFATPQALLDLYLARNVPAPEEAHIALVDGRIHAAQIERLPLDELPGQLVARVIALAGPTLPPGARLRGTVPTEAGDLRYRVVRVELPGGVGAFVGAALPAAELDEIRELQTYGALVSLLVVLLVVVAAWFLVGRMLAPVRELTATAHAISDSDLTSRVPVRGDEETVRMAESFNGMLDRIERVFTAERAFVDDASHALRDPLTIAMGYLTLLEDAPAAERARLAEVVQGEMRRMERIVTDLQRLADAEHPDFLRPGPFELGAWQDDLLLKARALGGRDWRLESRAAGSWVGDRDRLTEAVMNLAHNAVAHTRPGEAVALGVARDRGGLRLWVRDEGVGIAPADQARVFERFTRLLGQGPEYRGSGLGLAIVRAVAEAHAGRVELRSAPGRGSTFTIALPDPGDGA